MIGTTMVFDAMSVTADAYRADFLAAKRQYDDSVRELKENFVINSPLYKEKKKSIEARYKEAVQAARDKHLSEFMDILEKERKKEKSWAAAWGITESKDFEELENISKVPLSVDEFDLIAEKYAGKYYFVDRFLLKIAEDNGIDPRSVPVQPPIDKKLEVFRTAEGYVKRFINGFDGKGRASLELLVCDKTAYKLEREATGNYAGVYLDAESQAKRILSKSLEKGSMLERALYLSNAIKTSEPEVGEEMLRMLAEKSSNFLGADAMKMVGVFDVVERFRENDLVDIQDAEKAVDAIRQAQNHAQVMGTIYDNIHNRRFHQAIEREIEKTGNVKLKEDFERAKEIVAEAQAEGTGRYVGDAI